MFWKSTYIIKVDWIDGSGHMHTWRAPFRLGEMLAGHFLVAVRRVKHLKASRIN